MVDGVVLSETVVALAQNVADGTIPPVASAGADKTITCTVASVTLDGLIAAARDRKTLASGERGIALCRSEVTRGFRIPELRVALVTDAAALPFPPASLDLVVLPHTLELSADPHQVLRRVPGQFGLIAPHRRNIE